ncbi:hypothetical protein [Enterococcus sp. DIV0187]|uniref:hypothetical protein n=1 Tax=Enterococcus sp. DIV0187 TaxID=2774644 RepID=UPI003F1FBDBB
MKVFLKLLVVGLIATVVRIICQLLMPSSTNQTILAPSVFIESNTLPLAFSVLSLFAYMIIGAFILAIRTKKGQGIKLALSFCFLWSIYLFEPLPHVTSILSDSIVYVLADSLALLVIGGLIEKFFPTESRGRSGDATGIPMLSLVLPTLLFVLGRLSLYKVVGIYSFFDTHPLRTLLWCFVTGLISSVVALWLVRQSKENSRLHRPVLVGLLLYGINYSFFNSFMLLVFHFDVIDLALRTVVDIFAVSIGVLLVLSRKKE